MENPVQLTPRFTEAVDYARHVHVELRDGTQVPYMAHLLGVASLVLGETGHIGPHKHVSNSFYVSRKAAKTPKTQK
jgi:hypothetical protein